MNRNEKNLKEIQDYIDLILSSNFSDTEIMKREYPGVIEHDDGDREIAKEIYKDLKKMCTKYRENKISSKEFSNYCGDTMYSKYSPKIISKIVTEEIYDALDLISELDFYLGKESTA